MTIIGYFTNRPPTIDRVLPTVSFSSPILHLDPRDAYHHVLVHQFDHVGCGEYSRMWISGTWWLAVYWIGIPQSCSWTPCGCARRLLRYHCVLDLQISKKTLSTGDRLYNYLDLPGGFSLSRCSSSSSSC